VRTDDRRLTLFFWLISAAHKAKLQAEAALASLENDLHRARDENSALQAVCFLDLLIFDIVKTDRVNRRKRR